MAAAALTFTFSSCSSDGGDSNDSGSSSGSGSSSSSSTSLPVKYVKADDEFNGITVQYDGVKNITFKNGVATFLNVSKTEKTYNYSVDKANKRIYFAFKSITESDYKEKTYTSPSAYAKRDNNSIKKYGGYSEAALKARNDAETIFYSQIVSFTYEMTDKEIKVTPYYNGPVTALTGLDKMGPARCFSGGSYTGIEASHPGFGAIQVTLYKDKKLTGCVTKATKNTLECTYLSVGGETYDVGGKFTVEVTVNPESGNDAKAKMKLTAIDKALTVATGLEAGAESEELKFYGSDSATWTITESTTEAKKEETKTDTTTKTDTSASSSDWKLMYNGTDLWASDPVPEKYIEEFIKGFAEIGKEGKDYKVDRTTKTITILSLDCFTKFSQEAAKH